MTGLDRIALPARTRLHWYEVEDVCGHGGFGITYVASDTNTQQRVAIKEYMPAHLVNRDDDGTLRPTSADSAVEFRWGLERFIREARTLARFDHPGVVRIYTVFELHQTAYMVMRYEPGRSLASILRERGALEAEHLYTMLDGLLDGLEAVHEAGVIHRDIKPSNIQVRDDGSAVLLDFGSARNAIGRRSRQMTRIVSPGYAPLEQYSTDGAAQGPWTDIYSLGATLYECVTGKAPVDAVERSKGVLGSMQDILPLAADQATGAYPPALLEAIDAALKLKEAERPQSIGAWRAMLTVPPAPPEPAPGTTLRPHAPPRRATGPVLLTAALSAVLAGSIWYAQQSRWQQRLDDEMAKREQEAQALRATIAQLQNESEQAQAAAQRREIALDEREQELDQRGEDVTRKELGIQAATATLQEKTDALAKLDEALRQREQQVRSMEAELAAKTRQARDKPQPKVAADPVKRVAPAPPARPSASEVVSRWQRGDHTVAADLEYYAKQGDVPAQIRFAEAQMRGLGKVPKSRSGVATLRSLAQAGNDDATLRLSLAVADGVVSAPGARVVDWLTPAASLGHPNALYELGRYWNRQAAIVPKGAPKRLSLARRSYIWFGVAARCGHLEARQGGENVRSEYSLNRFEVAQADQTISSQVAKHENQPGTYCKR